MSVRSGIPLALNHSMDASTSRTAGRVDDGFDREACAEFSQELQSVEWMTVEGPAAARSNIGPIPATEHWYELSLVIAGSLIGVAIYFLVT